MNQNECESLLRDIGQDWPTDSTFVVEILERLDQEVEFKNSDQPQLKGMNMLKLNVIGFVTAAAVIVGLFFFLPDTKPVSASLLSAAIRKAVSQVKTIHIVTFGPNEETGELEAGADTWFVRGKGYARISHDGGFFQIDDGEYYWYREGKDAIVTRMISRNDEASFDNMTFPESDYERLPEEDITISGERLSCYSMKNLAPFEEGPQRCYTYVTDNQRIYKTVTWMHKDGRWNLFNEQLFFYNVDVDPGVFQPKLGNAKVIDLDEQFDELVRLENSLFTRNVDGFVYAVHRVRALQGGGAMIFASVRPSEVDPRPGFSARIYDASPQFDHDFRIELGNSQHNGISAQWFIRVPRDKHASWGNIDNGRLKIQETFSQRDESDMSIKGHQFKYVNLDVDVENWQQPISLEQAAKETHRDQQKIPNIGYRMLDAGIYFKEGVPYVRRSHVNSIDENEFADFVVGHLAYWRGRDSKAQQDAMNRAIKSGTVQVTMPGLDVNRFPEFNDSDLERATIRKDLVIIRADNTSLTDTGLKALIDLNALETLSLQSTEITDAGLEHLKSITSLRRLDVRDTKVTGKGISELQKANPELEIQSDIERE